MSPFGRGRGFDDMFREFEDMIGIRSSLVVEAE
jgi:hypothetical protein